MSKQWYLCYLSFIDITSKWDDLLAIKITHCLYNQCSFIIIMIIGFFCDFLAIPFVENDDGLGSKYTL